MLFHIFCRLIFNYYCFVYYRLLWREYLSQVVHAQNNGNETGQQPDSDPNSDQERNRYRYNTYHIIDTLCARIFNIFACV